MKSAFSRRPWPAAGTSSWRELLLTSRLRKISARDRQTTRSCCFQNASTTCANWASRQVSCIWRIAARFAPAPAPMRIWFGPARFSTAITSLSIRRRKGRKCASGLPIEPCLSLRARIITLRDLPAGQGVGYSAKFVTERPSRIAVINAGYADGISRQRTNRGCALVRGSRVPLVGAISMDLTTLDVTDLPDVELGDIVTIYGKDGNDAMVVSEIAREIGTVTSDLLVRSGPPRPALLPLRQARTLGLWLR